MSISSMGSHTTSGGDELKQKLINELTQKV
jgi:hypothetical protein